MSHFVAYSIFRQEDERRSQELELRRIRAVHGRREARKAFFAYAREWRDFVRGSSMPVAHA